MTHQKPTIVYGTAGVVAFSTEVLDQMLNTLEKHSVKEIDTAYIYVWLPPEKLCTMTDCDRYLVRRSSERLAHQASSRSLPRRPASRVGR